MKQFSRRFNVAASAERCAEVVFARSSSRKAAFLLDVILVASVSLFLALDLIVEVIQIVGVCLLVRKGSEKSLKAEKPVCGI